MVQMFIFLIKLRALSNIWLKKMITSTLSLLISLHIIVYKSFIQIFISTIIPQIHYFISTLILLQYSKPKSAHYWSDKPTLIASHILNNWIHAANLLFVLKLAVESLLTSLQSLLKSMFVPVYKVVIQFISTIITLLIHYNIPTIILPNRYF